jgi:hypothetical protein
MHTSTRPGASWVTAGFVSFCGSDARRRLSLPPSSLLARDLSERCERAFPRRFRESAGDEYVNMMAGTTGRCEVYSSATTHLSAISSDIPSMNLDGFDNTIPLSRS